MSETEDRKDAVAEAAGVAAKAVSDAAHTARDVVDAAQIAAADLADVAKATLTTLQSIDTKLDRFPDYESLLNIERVERKKGQRVQAALLAGLLLVVVAVGSLAYVWKQDQQQARRENRCAVHKAFADTVEVFTGGDPKNDPKHLGPKVLARINHDLRADCGE